MINIAEVENSLDKFLDDPGSVVPGTALILLYDCREAIQQLNARLSTEIGQNWLLRWELDEKKRPAQGVDGNRENR